MTTKRKTPKKHIVRSHIRNGSKVKSYIRGKDKIQNIKSVKTSQYPSWFKPRYLSDVLDEFEYGPRTFQQIKKRIQTARESFESEKARTSDQLVERSLSFWINKGYISEKDGKYERTPAGEKMYNKLMKYFETVSPVPGHIGAG